MKKYAIIVAAGTGDRMGTSTPKQFLPLRGKPVIWYCVTAFLDAYDDIEIILVLPKKHMQTGRDIIQLSTDPERVVVIAGGETRFHSVQNGLQFVRQESVVFVHDGVRCLLTNELIGRCYQGAVSFGSAIPTIDSKDSIRLISGRDNLPLDRNMVKLVQTPQTFLSSLLLPAYAVQYQERFTDEATVVEAAGHRVHLVEGDPTNIKLTIPLDLVLAESLLQERTLPI
jgi:2-C-methyl-D-erythritol 4-phosphate cytidylyltransferase